MIPLLIRTDASVEIGTGHLMRCLALATSLAHSASSGQASDVACARPTFVLAFDTPLEERLQAEGVNVVRIDAERGSDDDARRTATIASKHGAQWIVVDGYDFDMSYYQTLKENGLRVLCIDDCAHLPQYEVDLLLNQNISARVFLYEDKTNAKLLLGPRYALLRQEFLQAREGLTLSEAHGAESKGHWTRTIPEIATKILVTFGGSDTGNATALVLQALTYVNGSNVEVLAIIGAENPHRAELVELATTLLHTVSFEENVTDMPARMAWADIAISAAGITTWELLFMGLPFIVGILADNQEGNASELGKRNLALNVGRYNNSMVESLAGAINCLVRDKELRERLSQAGRRTVDGKGAQRVVEVMQNW